MLKRYKNALLAAIDAAGLDRNDFAGKEAVFRDLPSFVITYTPGKLDFIVRHPKENAHGFDFAFDSFPVFKSRQITFEPEQGWVDFRQVEGVFKEWLRTDVTAAIDEDLLPDLWADLNNAKLENEKNPGAIRLPFTDEEKKEVQLALTNFRLLIIQNFSPDQDQLKQVTDQLDYLAKAAERLNKFDWKGVAMSTLIGVSTALTLDTEQGRKLYGFFQQAFSGVIHLLN